MPRVHGMKKSTPTALFTKLKNKLQKINTASLNTLRDGLHSEGVLLFIQRLRMAAAMPSAFHS
jgi:hypothetical protein